MMKADELFAHAPGKAFIADAGYDSNRFRQASRDRKKRAVIGSKPERPRKLPKRRGCNSRRNCRLRTLVGAIPFDAASHVRETGHAGLHAGGPISSLAGDGVRRPRVRDRPLGHDDAVLVLPKRAL
jgi:IS5 family transposase